MKYVALFLGIAGSIVLASGCGGHDKPKAIDIGGPQMGGTHSGGKTSHPPAGSSAGGDDAGGDNAGADNAGGAGGANLGSGLVVTITTPAASSDPNKDDVIITNKVTTKCTVDGSASGSKVDATSIRLEVLGADGNPALGMDAKPLSAVGMPTANAGEYTADFDVGSIPTGVIGFRCSAKASQGPATGTATISTFVDHGPSIRVKEPADGSAHPLKTPMPVQFTVTPTPVADGDKGAAIADGSVHLKVAGIEIVDPDLTEDPKNPGTWIASVNFLNPLYFAVQPPEHTSVHIEAANTRKPMAVTAIADYPIIVDSQGPTIMFVTPIDNAAVHGETVVTFTATDTGSGLDIDTLYVTVTGLDMRVKYDAADKSTWGRNGNTFSFRFDTGLLRNIQSQLTVSVDANDTAGNPANTATRFFYKDDQPPAIDLDPGNARVLDAQNACSMTFDPLASALNDLAQTSDDVNLLRALVYDQANEAVGQRVLYFAGADQTSARLYAQVDPTKDFLVDTDNDGVCDALSIDQLPAKAVQSLKPVTPTSTLRYSQTDFATAPAVASNGATCKLLPDGGPINRLCPGKNSDMTTVVGHDIVSATPEPVVYAMGGLLDAECTGSGWNFRGIPGADGWICFAARAVDKLGNIGISRPLRICYDNPDVPGQPACWNGGEPPPSCTTNCSPPAAFPAHIYRYF